MLQFTSTNTNAIKKHEVLYIKLEKRRTGHRFYGAIVKDITKWDSTFENMLLDKMNKITTEKRGELWYSWRVERFCSSSRSRRVTRFNFGDNAYSVISLEREQDCIWLRQAEHIRGHLLHRYSVTINQFVIATETFRLGTPDSVDSLLSKVNMYCSIPTMWVRSMLREEQTWYKLSIMVL